jgi:hypothetical protein
MIIPAKKLTSPIIPKTIRSSFFIPMNFELSEQQKAISSWAASIAEALVVNRHKRASPFFSEADWKTCADKGLPGLIIPREQGGAGLSMLETALTLEGLTRGQCDGGLAFSIGAHLLAGLFPLVKFASPELQQLVFPKIIAGEYLLANAMTESGSGSDAFSMKSQALPTAEGYLLHGKKVFVTNAPLANGLLVYAVTDKNKGFFGGISCFLLEKGKHHFEIHPSPMQSGYRTTVSGEIFIDELSVSSDCLVGKEGGGAMIFHESMIRERACMALMHCGTMQLLIERAVNHVKGRETSKGPLAEKQAVQFHLAEMATQSEAARLLALKALHEIDSGNDATVSSARAKIACSEALDFVARTALKLEGAQGFMPGSDPAAEAILIAQAAAIYSGPNDVLRELIAGRS